MDRYHNRGGKEKAFQYYISRKRCDKRKKQMVSAEDCQKKKKKQRENIVKIVTKG